MQLPELNSGAGRLIRTFGLIVLAILLGYLTIVFGVTNAARAGNPELALSYFNRDARALEFLADRKLRENMTPAALEEARKLAADSLSRDPTSVRAVRTLAIDALAKGDKPKADQLMRQALDLSRRDLPTLLYFIDREVARDNVPGALHYFDIALRTSKASQATLYPILASAITDDRLMAPMARFFALDQDWLPSFIDNALSQRPSAVNLSRVLMRVPETKASRDPHLRRVVLSRLVNDGEYVAAFEFFRTIGGRGAVREGWPRDGNFRAEPVLPPFDWVYVQEAALGANRTARAAPSPGLRYYASIGMEGVVARQLTILPPGSYALEVEANNGTSDRYAKPLWRIVCAPPANRLLGSIDISPSGESFAKSKGTFSVPASNCSAQWLELELRASQDAQGVEGVVRQIRITRL